MKRKSIDKRSQKPKSGKDLKSEIDRLRQLAEADIDYSDIPATDAAFWANAEVTEPAGKSMISIRIDTDVLEWYRHHARRYQTLMNAVLRKFKEAREREETTKS